MCSHTFKTVQVSKIHNEKVHKAEMVPGTKTVVILNPESDSCCDTPSNTRKVAHNCQTCMKEFPSLKALRLHQFWKHDVSSANNVIAMESEQQDLLATSSASAGIDCTSVCRASVIGTKEFCCSTCGQHFSTNRALKFSCWQGTQKSLVNHHSRMIILMKKEWNTQITLLSV